MHWYTCKCLLNTLGRAVEQLAGCLAKEPKVSSENGKLSIYIYVYIYMYIYMFGTCVFRICIHPAPFVRDAIFPHCMTRLAEQKG